MSALPHPEAPTLSPKAVTMPRFIDWLGGVLGELRRRNVLHVGAVYAVGAWVVLQVAAITFPALFFPRWALTLVIVLAILGFPVALVLAWRYDVDEDGLRRVERMPSFTGADEPTRRGVAVVLLLVGVIATAGASWTAMRAWGAARAGAVTGGESGSGNVRLDPKRIAVLPFDDHSADDRLGGVASGLTGDLIRELDRVEGLELVSYTGVQPFHDPDVTLDSVARILRAGTLVEGSVEPAGDSLAVSVHLVDGSTDTRLGSVRLTEERDSLLALRAALVEEVARELRERLGTRLEFQQLRAGAENDRAWELFHRARQMHSFADTLALRGDTASARQLYGQADSLFSVADSLNPGWVAPTVERARVALTRAQLGPRSTVDLDTAWLAEGNALATEAIEEAPRNADSYGVRGVVRHSASQVPGFDPEWASRESAEADLRKAVDLDPQHSRAWAELSLLLERTGRRGEALVAARRSKEADPFLGNDIQYLFNSAWLELQLQNFEEAEKLLQRGRSLFPQNPAYDLLYLTLLAGPEGPRSDPDSAWALLEESGYGSWPPARLLVAASLVRAGLPDSARTMMHRARAAAPDHPFTLYNAANVYQQLGHPDSAVAMLRAYLDTVPGERAQVANDWWFASLRDRDDFRELIESSGAAASGGGA